LEVAICISKTTMQFQNRTLILPNGDCGTYFAEALKIFLEKGGDGIEFHRRA